MTECRTVEFLRSIHAEDGDLALVARSALALVDQMHTQDINPIALIYLHELIDHIYQGAGGVMLQHLYEGADCAVCAALLAHQPS